MAYSFPATVLIITDVLFVTLASSVVLSTLLPSASFSSIPNNSINAPLVPDPSSLDTTVIALLLSNSEPELSPVPVPAESPELLPQPVRHPGDHYCAQNCRQYFLHLHNLFSSISIPDFSPAYSSLFSDPVSAVIMFHILRVICKM